MAGPNQVPGPTAIRAPTPSIDNHQVVLTQLKETTETAQRLRGNPNESYVKLGELINAGIINFIGGVVSPGKNIGGGGSGSGGTVDVLDSITGDGSTGSPLQLDGDSESPGNSKLYGTNSSGTKGWYTQPSDGGGSSPFNVTPDTHGTIPTGVGVGLNDEFEGASLDTGGTRYAGAEAWSWVNQNGATATLGEGGLTMTCDPAASGDNNNIILQPMSASTWTMQIKYGVTHGNGGSGSFGFIVRNSANGRYTKFGVYNPGNYQPLVQQLINPTLYNANPLIGGQVFPGAAQEMQWLYLQVINDGTSLHYSWSLTGLAGSWIFLYSETLSSWLGAVTDVGLGVNQNTTGGSPAMLVDWFRRIA